MMNEILSKYFNEEEVDKLLKGLENNQRSKIINDKYFAKIGNNSDELFFNNLKRELTIYEDNSDNENLPLLIDYYLDDEICLIILKRIEGLTIGNNRNDFDVNISEEERITIAESILNIKDMKVKGNLDNTYNREEKLDKYLERSKKYLSSSLYDKVKSLKDKIINEKYERVISHGDLISTNIMISDNKPFIIDWEFISMKPKFYDLIYFLLFSKTNHSTDVLYKMNLSNDEINESLKDGIIICLKEIYNNAKLFGKIDESIINNNIERWACELTNIVDKVY